MTDFDWMKERDALCGRPDSNDDLIARNLRTLSSRAHLSGFYEQECRIAADALEKQARRIAELEATIREFQLVENALNFFLERDTPYEWRYSRQEAERRAWAALEKKNV